MRWLTFVILALLSICVHTTLSPRLMIIGAYPDFVVILMVHYVLHAHGTDGLLAAWSLGVLMDLTSVERFGIVSLSFGFVAGMLWLVRELMFRRHPLTHLSVTVVSCLTIQLLLRGIHMWWHDAGVTWWQVVVQSLFTALYTGIAAVAVHYLLLKVSRPLGLVQSKRHAFNRDRRMRLV